MKITDQHMAAVTRLARGLNQKQIARQLRISFKAVKQLCTEVGEAWHVTTQSGLAIAFLERLTPEERTKWEEWAAELYSYLCPSNRNQRLLMAAFAKMETANRTLADLKSEFGTSEKRLEKDLHTLLGDLPVVETRAGLTAICYLNASQIQQTIDDTEDRPSLSPRQLQVMRLIALGLTNQEISAELDDESRNTVRPQIRCLLEIFGANSRSRLGLAYVRWYQPAKERAKWQKQISFDWPDEEQPMQLKQLRLMLTWEYCDAEHADLASELNISVHTTKAHMKTLMGRIDGLPRTRPSVLVAAELHRPR